MFYRGLLASRVRPVPNRSTSIAIPVRFAATAPRVLLIRSEVLETEVIDCVCSRVYRSPISKGETGSLQLIGFAAATYSLWTRRVTSVCRAIIEMRFTPQIFLHASYRRRHVCPNGRYDKIRFEAESGTSFIDH